jgi:hypothetical protein
LAEALRIGVVAGLGFPLALLGRRLARGARRAAWEKAHAPHRMSEVTDAWRSAARVEDVKPLVPRTIALPLPEEGVVRLPDHYDG